MKVDIGQTVRCTGLARYIITDGDPLSARCEIGYTEYIEWHGTVLGHESCGNPTCDATRFTVRLHLRVTANGCEIFARDWRQRIPRDQM